MIDRAPTTEHRTDKTVFIVDDHAGYRDIASSVVDATIGFRSVGAAKDAVDAIDSIESLATPPDLVLMDVRLGEQSGITATRVVKKSFPTTKVVLVSTLEEDELPPESSSCGAAGYLPKVKLSTTTLEALWGGAYDWSQ